MFFSIEQYNYQTLFTTFRANVKRNLNQTMPKSQHSLPVDPERFQPARKPPSEPGSGSCTEVVTLYSKSFMRSY